MLPFVRLVGVFVLFCGALALSDSSSAANVTDSSTALSTSAVPLSVETIVPSRDDANFSNLNQTSAPTQYPGRGVQKSSIPKKKHSKFAWNSVTAGDENSLSYMLNCTPTHMIIQVNLTGVLKPTVYLEKLKSFSICRPKIVKNIATFHLSLDDDFYRCGTIKVHDAITNSKVYYNRVIVESANSTTKTMDKKSVYLKCSMPNIAKLIAKTVAGRMKRASREQHTPLGSGQLVNFTEIDLPDNFMEAEILDFGEPITQKAPYPHLNIKVKRNGQFVNTSLNVAPGTPLEMIIYLDDKSKHVYGLLGTFMKVTDNGARQREEVIVLNGCSVDPYIFGNFETEDDGDSISAKFRAFKFPESNYVMFAGTVNVCLNKCKPVDCGQDIRAFGRRKRRSVGEQAVKDSNKLFEIEMVTYLQVSYTPSQLQAKKDSIDGLYESKEAKSQHEPSGENIPVASKLVKSDHKFEGEARPISSQYQTNSSSRPLNALSAVFFVLLAQCLAVLFGKI